jgi:hypothetical protein
MVGTIGATEDAAARRVIAVAAPPSIAGRATPYLLPSSFRTVSRFDLATVSACLNLRFSLRDFFSSL